jgi:four helix bundle protein
VNVGVNIDVIVDVDVDVDVDVIVDEDQPGKEKKVLSYQKLDVYQCSTKFLALSYLVLNDLPPGYSFLADQLKRASLSIPLNIAEGSGKVGKKDSAKFYGIARGSSMECAAILDICRVLKVADEGTVEEGRELLVRIVGMLTKMCR